MKTVEASLSITLDDPLEESVLLFPAILHTLGLELVVTKGSTLSPKGTSRYHWTINNGCCQKSLHFLCRNQQVKRGVTILTWHEALGLLSHAVSMEASAWRRLVLPVKDHAAASPLWEGLTRMQTPQKLRVGLHYQISHPDLPKWQPRMKNN